MNDHDSIPCPKEFQDYWCARATYAGEIITDVIQISELIESDRRAVEIQKERDSLSGDFVSPYGIIGIYRTSQEASAALDWVQAWRSGS